MEKKPFCEKNRHREGWGREGRKREGEEREKETEKDYLSPQASKFLNEEVAVQELRKPMLESHSYRTK